MARKISSREIKKSNNYFGENPKTNNKKNNPKFGSKVDCNLIVEGTSENKYFSKLRSAFNNIKYKIIGGKSDKDTYSTGDLKKVKLCIEDLVNSNIPVYYIVDMDRIVFDKMNQEDKAWQELLKTYKDNEKVIFCDSTPSFEFWILLYFDGYKIKNYNKNGEDAKELKNYFIKDYGKGEIDKYDIYQESKLKEACERAKTINCTTSIQSNTKVWKIVEKIIEK